MSKFVFSGLTYRLKEGTPADVAHLINSAKQDAKRMEMFHDPSVKVQKWTKPGKYHIRKIFDQTFVDLIYEEKFREEVEERRYTIESIRDIPIPVWEIYQGNYPLIGWAIPMQTDWVKPAFYVEKSDKITEPKFFFSTNPDLSTIEMYEVYPLDDIGTEDVADYAGDWDWDDERLWGEDEEWLSPEHAVLGIAEPSDQWELAVHAVSHCFVRVTGTAQLYFLWMDSSCLRTPAIAVQQDRFTGSYFTSFPIENEDHTVRYPPGDYQYYVRYSTGWIKDSMKIGDVYIYDYYQDSHVEFRQWGDIMNCDTYASMLEQYSGDTWMSDEHRGVVGVDGYDDLSCGIALWGHQVIEYPKELYRGPISPWCSEPYDGAGFYGSEDCFVYHNLPPIAEEYTQQLKIKAFSPDYTVEEYVGDSEYGNYNTAPNPQALDSNSAWDVGIYDFHKKPFFLFSWYDHRQPFMCYGLVWDGKVKLSERFECGGYWHDVYEARDKLGGNAKGFFTACGLRTTIFKEVKTDGNYRESGGSK